MKSWIGFGDHDLIFKVTPVIKLLNLRPKNACLHISWTDWQILTKFIMFHDMHNIFKVTAGLIKITIEWFGGGGRDICFSDNTVI